MEGNQKSPQAVAAACEEKTNSIENKPYRDVEHDYGYLKTILSESDIERLEHALKTGRTIIVDGIQGPTGKTTLVRYLKERGATVVEEKLSEKFILNETLKTHSLRPFKSLI